MTIYFDHNATTPLHPDVFEAMRPWLTERHGNASSLHRAGREARAAIDTARGQVADCVNAHPSQVIFTAGGTEADNMALKGVAAMRAPGRMLISPIEHPAITDAAGAPAETATEPGRSPDEASRTAPPAAPGPDTTN